MVAAVPESDRKARPQPSKQDTAAAGGSTEDLSKEAPAASADKTDSKADSKSDGKQAAKAEGTDEGKPTEASAEVRPPIDSGVRHALQGACRVFRNCRVIRNPEVYSFKSTEESADVMLPIDSALWHARLMCIDSACTASLVIVAYTPSVVDEEGEAVCEAAERLTVVLIVLK